MKEYNFYYLTGEVITFKDDLYDEARQEWNRSIDKYPLAIVYCNNKEDVSNAIKWTIKNKVGFRIRGGGHNYEGYSVGDLIIVIDISRLNKIHIDKERNIVKIQGGVKNSELYEAVSILGYPFPGGSCPTVGVSGYTLGGGWGYSCRYLGLGADSLKSIELIDFRGRLITANNYRNSELFWACKGAGGGNFGVVVSLTYNLPKKVREVTLINVYFPNCTKEKLCEIFKAVQGKLPVLDRKLTILARIYNSKEEGIASYTTGLYYGNKKEAIEEIKFLTNIEGAQLEVDSGSFIEIIRKIMSNYPPYEKFKSTGRFVCRKYTDEEIQGFIELIMSRPKDSIYSALGMYALGGAVSDLNSDASAFYYRKANYIIGIQSVWLNNEYRAENVRWVEERFKYIYKLTTGSFINFPYSELKDYEKEYYGNNKCRLRSVKKYYDPCNIFRYPQSIKV